MSAPVTTSYLCWVLDPAVPVTSPQFGRQYVVIRRTRTDTPIGGPFPTVAAAERFLAAQRDALPLEALW